MSGAQRTRRPSTRIQLSAKQAAPAFSGEVP